MSIEAQLVIDIWESVKEFIPQNKRADVAENLVSAFAHYGFESSELSDIGDDDDALADAYDIVFERDDEEE